MSRLTVASPIVLCLLISLGASPVSAYYALPYRHSTDHFNLHYHSAILPSDFLGEMETVYEKTASLLSVFVSTPVARINIYVYPNSSQYQASTGRPSWSHGTADTEARSMSIFEEGEDWRQKFMTSALPHELCHILINDFFRQAGTSPPRWIDEGMAVFAEAEVSGQQNRWRTGYRYMIKSAGAVNLKEFLGYRQSHDQYKKGEGVSLWYAQAYSVVEFMLRTKGMALFHQFCDAIRKIPSHYLQLEPGALEKIFISVYAPEFDGWESLGKAWQADVEGPPQAANPLKSTQTVPSIP